MGGFYGSIHVRTDSNQHIKAVLETIAKKKKHKFYLSPPINGWVSIFPDGSGQDERVSRYIAKHLDYDILHLLVHDDDIFCYWYYRKGSLVDEYNSRPGYFGEFVSHKKREKLKGNPDVFKELVTDQSKILQIRDILHSPQQFDNNAILDKKTNEQIKRFEKINKGINKFINDPDAMLHFLSENPHILESNMKPLAEEAKSKNLKSPEEIQKLITCSQHTQDIMIKIVTDFAKSRGFMNEAGNWTGFSSGAPTNSSDDKMNTKEGAIDKVKLCQPPAGLFASETMSRFASLLGITNAVTSYEYLADGETDNILEWDKFVEVL
ncbi:MAG: hypothetical protein MUO27_08360 [Sedimentisphaerales bacterium]|nr:hypothetical protein [Sedimentisphaerales bacterium]